MRKSLSISIPSFILGSLLFTFSTALANQTLSTYYPSPKGTYTKVHLINTGNNGPSADSFCQQVPAGSPAAAPGSGANFVNAGTIFADSNTGYLEICKKDGTVASYPGSSFNRFGNGPCPALSANPCPNNYKPISCQSFKMDGSTTVHSWSCGFTGSGNASSSTASSIARSGCFSIYSTTGQPDACNSVASGDANAYDMGCETLGNTYKRNCCFNASSAGSFAVQLCTAPSCTSGICPVVGGVPNTCGADTCGNAGGCGICSGSNVCSNGHCCGLGTAWNGSACVVENCAAVTLTFPNGTSADFPVVPVDAVASAFCKPNNLPGTLAKALCQPTTPATYSLITENCCTAGQTWDSSASACVTLNTCQGAVPGNASACSNNPNPPNGTTIYSIVASCLPAAACQSVCNPGFNLIGGTCLKACSANTLSTPCGNATLPGVASGSPSTISCPSGCTGGPLTATCTNGSWSSVSGSCVTSTCSDDIVSTPCGNATLPGVASGSPSTISCPSGCTGGPLTATCTNGSWSSVSGSCIQQCPATSLSLNGTTASFSVTDANSTGTGTCAVSGGTASAPCGPTGNWGSATGTCCPAGQFWNGSLCTTDLCQGSVPDINASPCINNPAPSDTTTTYSLVGSCTPATPCQSMCKPGFTLSGGACVANTCTGSIFNHASICGNNPPPSNPTTSYSLVASCNPAAACQTSCISGFHLSGGVCVCTPSAACPSSNGCSTDSCGNSCGSCDLLLQTCSSQVSGVPGTCNNICAPCQNWNGSACVSKIPCGTNTCGTDSCGNSCGTCPGTLSCTGGSGNPGTCPPPNLCGTNNCGTDIYDHSCGVCATPNVCIDGLGHPGGIHDPGTCQCQCDSSCQSCNNGSCFINAVTGGTCISDDDCGPGELCSGFSGGFGSCIVSSTVPGTHSIDRCIPDCGGKTCGSDGCGGSCGCGCASGYACTFGQCTPCPTVCPPGEDCGTMPNGCGVTLNCGSCTSPNICVANKCGCTATTTCPANGSCGANSDNCGGTCSCPSGQSCSSGTCACSTGNFWNGSSCAPIECDSQSLGLNGTTALFPTTAASASGVGVCQENGGSASATCGPSGTWGPASGTCCPSGKSWNGTSCVSTPVNGVCSTTKKYYCDQGDLSNSNYTSPNYTWDCDGVNGGTNSSCSLGCVAATCGSLNANCGTPADGCASDPLLNCGSCPPSGQPTLTTCSTSNQCVCTAGVCPLNGGLKNTCGPDTCGNPNGCGSCPAGNACVNGMCLGNSCLSSSLPANATACTNDSFPPTNTTTSFELLDQCNPNSYYLVPCQAACNPGYTRTIDPNYGQRCKPNVCNPASLQSNALPCPNNINPPVFNTTYSLLASCPATPTECASTLKDPLCINTSLPPGSQPCLNNLAPSVSTPYTLVNSCTTPGICQAACASGLVLSGGACVPPPNCQGSVATNATQCPGGPTPPTSPPVYWNIPGGSSGQNGPCDGSAACEEVCNSGYSAYCTDYSPGIPTCTCSPLCTGTGTPNAINCSPPRYTNPPKQYGGQTYPNPSPQTVPVAYTFAASCDGTTSCQQTCPPNSSLSGGTCVPNSFKCQGITQSNTFVCSNNPTLTDNTHSFSLVNSCAPPSFCQITCNSGYTLSGGVCVMPSCQGTVYPNTTPCSNNVAPTDNTHSYTLVASTSCTSGGSCQENCLPNYSLQNGACVPNECVSLAPHSTPCPDNIAPTNGIINYSVALTCNPPGICLSTCDPGYCYEVDSSTGVASCVAAPSNGKCPPVTIDYACLGYNTIQGTAISQYCPGSNTNLTQDVSISYVANQTSCTGQKCQAYCSTPGAADLSPADQATLAANNCVPNYSVVCNSSAGFYDQMHIVFADGSTLAVNNKTATIGVTTSPPVYAYGISNKSANHLGDLCTDNGNIKTSGNTAIFHDPSGATLPANEWIFRYDDCPSSPDYDFNDIQCIFIWGGDSLANLKKCNIDKAASDDTSCSNYVPCTIATGTQVGSPCNTYTSGPNIQHNINNCNTTPADCIE